MMVSPEALERWVYQHTGMRLAEGRLSRLARPPHLPMPGTAAFDALLDTIIVGETWFFREPHSLEVWRDRAQPQRPLRVLSAGCSTGEEAYSIAMLLCEWGISAEIIGIDLSLGALAQGRAGRYTPYRLRATAPPRQARFFRPVVEDWEVLPEIRRRVSLIPGNLVGDMPDCGLFDLILCRNVLLYFDDDSRRRAGAGLARRLRPDGFLIHGLTEGLLDMPPFRPVWHQGMRLLAAP